MKYRLKIKNFFFNTAYLWVIVNAVIVIPIPGNSQDNLVERNAQIVERFHSWICFNNWKTENIIKGLRLQTTGLTLMNVDVK